MKDKVHIERNAVPETTNQDVLDVDRINSSLCY